MQKETNPMSEENQENTETGAVKRHRIAPREAQHQDQTDVREAQHVSNHAPQRTRRRKTTTTHDDPFYIPVDEIPEGLSYEWKRWSVAGQHDPFYVAGLREQGWEPVPPKRHPNWVPPGYNEPHIIKGGQILMDRPIELTEEARKEQRMLAKQQQREAEQRLGMSPRDTLERVAPKIQKEYMRPMTVSED